MRLWPQRTQERLIVLEAHRKSRHTVQISVADSGSGVIAEVADRLFEPFTTTKPEGMGMGLSISRSIIESHGGRLRMFQRVGSGATFVFDLPTGGHDPSRHAG
jgi:signal transduction histidine kinase